MLENMKTKNKIILAALITGIASIILVIIGVLVFLLLNKSHSPTMLPKTISPGFPTESPNKQCQTGDHTKYGLGFYQHKIPKNFAPIKYGCPKNSDDSCFRIDHEYLDINIYEHVALPHVWFLGKSFEKIRIYRNGVVTFDEAGLPRPEFHRTLPSLYNESSFQAVFWADIDPNSAVYVNFIHTNKDSSVLPKIRDLIATYLSPYVPFHPTQAMIVTWEDVKPSDGSETPFKNWIQYLLTADDSRTFTLSLYSNITWSVSKSEERNSSNGQCKRDSSCYPAVIGFQQGDVHVASFSTLTSPLRGPTGLNGTMIISQIDAEAYPEFSTYRPICKLLKGTITPISWFNHTRTRTIQTPPTNKSLNIASMNISQHYTNSDKPTDSFYFRISLVSKDASFNFWRVNIELSHGTITNLLTIYSDSGSNAHFGFEKAQCTYETGTNPCQTMQLYKWFHGSLQLITVAEQNNIVTVNFYHSYSKNIQRFAELTVNLKSSSDFVTFAVDSGYIKGLPYHMADPYWHFLSKGLCLPYYNCPCLNDSNSNYCCYELHPSIECQKSCKPLEATKVDEPHTTAIIHNSCSQFNDSATFHFCYDSFFEELLSLCSKAYDKTGENYAASVCAYGDSIAEYCSTKLFPGTVLLWKEEFNCVPNCTEIDKNSEYSQCVSPCEPTCSNPTNQTFCRKACYEGCTCKSGYILGQNGKCKPEDHCGCTDNHGYYHELNTTWYDLRCSEHCSCNKGEVKCKQLIPCPLNSHCVVSGVSDISCQCDTGFRNISNHCHQITYCKPNSCPGHSKCIEGLIDYTCYCDAGYTGSFCNKTVEYCTENSCLNGGTCYEIKNGFNCACPAGAAGEHCEQLNACTRLPGPCANGGTCIPSSSNEYFCNCLPYYSGKNCSKIFTTSTTSTTTSKPLPTSCADIYAQNGFEAVDRDSLTSMNRCYNIYLNGQTLSIYCDMAAGGYSMIMRNMDSTVSFNRSLADYQGYFGNCNTGSYWMGLENMRTMLSQPTCGSQLRVGIAMCNKPNNTFYENYNYFSIGSYPGYVLSVSTGRPANGDAFNSQDMFGSTTNGQSFSTLDHNQSGGNTNCMADYGAGWWFAQCGEAILTGQWSFDPTCHVPKSRIIWNTWDPSNIVYADMAVL